MYPDMTSPPTKEHIAKNIPPLNALANRPKNNKANNRMANHHCLLEFVAIVNNTKHKRQQTQHTNKQINTQPNQTSKQTNKQVTPP